MALCQHQSLSTQLWWNKCPLGILFNWDTPPRRQITTFPFYRWRSFFSKLSNLLKVTLLYWFKDRVQLRTLVCQVPTPCTSNSFAFNPKGIKGFETEDSVYKTHLGWVFIKPRGFFFGGGCVSALFPDNYRETALSDYKKGLTMMQYSSWYQKEKNKFASSFGIREMDFCRVWHKWKYFPRGLGTWTSNTLLKSWLSFNTLRSLYGSSLSEVKNTVTDSKTGWAKGLSHW